MDGGQAYIDTCINIYYLAKGINLRIMRYLTIILILISTQSFSQERFEWEIIKDVERTQSEIYSGTKMFISTHIASSSNIVLNDNEENGVILIRNKVIERVDHSMNTYHYVYEYDITFKMKGNKYKLAINNITCVSAYAGNNRCSVAMVQPFMGYDYDKPRGSVLKFSLPKKKAYIMMDNLKDYFELMIANYNSYITTIDLSDNW